MPRRRPRTHTLRPYVVMLDPHPDYREPLRPFRYLGPDGPTRLLEEATRFDDAAGATARFLDHRKGRDTDEDVGMIVAYRHARGREIKLLTWALDEAVGLGWGTERLPDPLDPGKAQTSLDVFWYGLPPGVPPIRIGRGRTTLEALRAGLAFVTAPN